MYSRREVFILANNEWWLRLPFLFAKIIQKIREALILAFTFVSAFIMSQKLSPNEIRDILAYLEAGKPLPEKYRWYLFEDKKEVELVWNGKTHDVTNVTLPFQTIEHVDEPRIEEDMRVQGSLFDIDDKWRQLTGWTNKLIWWDNKLVLSSLRNWPMRREIEKAGGIKLIYIDPPFDVGADFSMKVEIGDEEFTKSPTVLEELAYRDTWGKWADSFISMIYERLSLMRDLLAPDGSIYVHCDWRVNSYMRLILNELFWSGFFKNEIIWQRDAVWKWAKKNSSQWSREIECILYYSKSDNHNFQQLYKEGDELTHTQLKEFRYKNPDWRLFKIVTLWDYSQKSIEAFRLENLIYTTSTWQDYKKYYLDEFQLAIGSLWNDIPNISHWKNPERLDYPTQKPEKLLRRIIEASSNPWDLVADFFCGSGTTLAVAEKLGRKWIGADIGKFGIHTTRKRMIGVQRGLKTEGKDWRAFEILNLGRYERGAFLSSTEKNRSSSDSIKGIDTTDTIESRIASEKRQIDKKKHSDFISLVCQAYKWEPITGVTTLHGQKSGRVFAIWPVDMPVGRDYIEAVLAECRAKGFSRVDILGFEWEMSVWPHIIEEMKKGGIDLALKYIPRDVFDKRAIEKWQVRFFDIAYIEARPHIDKRSVSIELTDFSVFYTQDDIDVVIERLKDGKSSIIMDGGQIWKVSKSSEWIVEREVLTKKWTDWIDYWSVDWDYESRDEVVNIQDETWEWQTVKTGNHVFENEWQSFRTKRDKTLELTTPSREYANPGKKKIAIKVIDIFGNDNMKILEITI